MTTLYEKSGVSVENANILSENLAKNLNIKDFAGSLNSDIFKGYSMVVCCDGIGSKVLPLYEKKMYKQIAVDLVAANLNDLVTKGANALAFVDYIAINKLDNDAVFEIVKELKFELAKYNCELLGGETSELSELINKIDISGTAIGFVSENINFEKIVSNDIVIGLKSSGVHANGFSLIRHNFDNLDEFLIPTYNYYNEIIKCINQGLIKSCANITGGGIFSNLIRSIPEKLSVNLDYEKIPPQNVFKKLKQMCGEETYEVFNMGVGFCIVADRKNKKKIFEICEKFSPFEFGNVVEV